MPVARTLSRSSVANSGDRPIQVGSHYHFFETNDRAEAFERDGCTTACASTLPPAPAVRFEPGQSRSGEACGAGRAIGVVYGFQGKVMGELRGKLKGAKGDDK
jgi:urease subunit beta